MRAHAQGLCCAVAAVELLIGHALWLRRNDFVSRFVKTTDDLVGMTMLAWVNWEAVVRALGSGQLPCSGSESQLLRVAASIAEGVPVDLGAALTGLDEGNLMLVADAVLCAGGLAAVAVGGDRR